MWLDMQGMELPTLKNAGFILETTTAICERDHRLYRGCATYNEIIEWMRRETPHSTVDQVRHVLWEYPICATLSQG